MGNYLELWTYGEYDSEDSTNYGISFEVPEHWLENKIKNFGFRTIEGFMNNYIWDTSEQLLKQADHDGVLGKVKCGKFGHQLDRECYKLNEGLTF